MSESTILSNLDINILTKKQYESITKDENALYMVVDDVTPIECGGTGAMTIAEARKNLGISDMNILPSVTAEDNGKILMVVNGSWAVVDALSASK